MPTITYPQHAIDTDASPDPTIMKEKGLFAVGRYPLGNNALGKPEVARLTSAGIWIFTLCELNPDIWQSGRTGGYKFAQQFVAACEALGQHKGSALFFAVDRDAIGMGLGWLALEFWRGTSPVAREAGYLAGGYAEEALLQEALSGTPRNPRILDVGYQAGAWNPDNASYPGIHGIQLDTTVDVGGVTCDQAVILSSDFGLWNGTGVLETPTVPEHPGEIPMLLGAQFFPHPGEKNGKAYRNVVMHGLKVVPLMDDAHQAWCEKEGAKPAPGSNIRPVGTEHTPELPPADFLDELLG